MLIDNIEIVRINQSIADVDESNQVPPDNINLSQNYPNPFNPTTKIEYSVPTVGISLMKFLQLKVYDILGNEVATLVNEEKPAGNYEVEFNGNHLSSGIYFYVLKVGENRFTKKMCLIK